MKVLIIEDDNTTRDFVATGLRQQYFVVDEARDGIEGLTMAASCDYQLVILDRMLPGLDGLKVLAAIRATGNQVPVMILSALNSVDDRVTGLTAGSDDYLIKPFALAELIARAQILTQRNKAAPSVVMEYTYADLSMDLRTHRVWRAGTQLLLQPKEFLILQYLMERAEQVVSRMQVFEAVWSYHFDPKTNVIDVHIANLRRKLDENGGETLIHTVRGAGYVLRQS
ncbi:transcriptional regulator [Photobacterium aquae]|uniref:Transcriptional regulator n=1 Tax=Photobacterium aquae TaxID=1195763 RepID=A0A0J1JYA9_9GAMM|nr:response regulator transcription factor [Photobacterium aquae]KLV07232.1 transcriptional regulator [Photobacterium aquae]